MKHTLLITKNHFRSLDLNQTLQTVVADDDATVEVVQVACGETATVQCHQRTKVRWSHRNVVHDHPFRLVAASGRTEGLHNLQTLQRLSLALLGGVGVCTVTKLVGELVEVDAAEHELNGLCSHHGDELVRVIVRKLLVALRKLVNHAPIFFF